MRYNRVNMSISVHQYYYYSRLRSMWPEGAHDITATTKRPLTAGTIFKNSMNALMKILASKEPFYVRCIKVISGCYCGYPKVTIY